MNLKDKKAAYLLDEIGGIDDRYVAEAIAVRKKPKTGKVILILAACIAAISVMLLSIAGAFTLGRIVGGVIRDDISDNRPQPAEALGELLKSESRAADVIKAADASEIDFFGGAYLIWQTGDDDGYCLKKLSDDSLKVLLGKIGGSNVGTENEVTFGAKVWISCGDGTVISPYLKAAAGNVGYGELFDYSPEIIPSESFNSCVSNLFG